MNPEIKTEWIVALRSSDYEQGTGELRTQLDQYCCLGVLCDLAVKAGIAKWEMSPDSGWIVVPIDKTYESASADDIGGATVPRFIQDWSGLESGNPRILIKGSDATQYDQSLAFLNDGEGRSFSQIAKVISEHL